MAELTERITGLSPAKRALLELRLRKNQANRSPVGTITRRSNRDSAAVSFAQQRLWFLDQIERERSAYNVPRAIALTGLLNVEALQHALNELITRHEALRTHFSSVDGALRQIISAASRFSLPIIDLGNLARDERETRAKQLADEETIRPFDLARGPVIRAQLLRLSEQEHVLLLTTHHIVSDAWSAQILFRELGALYNAFTSGAPSPLVPLPIQYSDFAEWQRDWLQGQVLEEQLDYWRKKLDGVNGTLELPTDHPRPAVSTARGACQILGLSPELSAQLSDLSRVEGATLFMTLLAAFQTLLYRYTDEEDIVVGSPIAGRNRGETEGLIGFFVNTLALRTNLSGDPTFRELLARVKETAVDAYAHQDLPFEKLVEELHPERELNRNPFFQMMFQFQGGARAPLEMNGLAVRELEVLHETAKFDLMLVAVEENSVLTFLMEYCTDLFTRETIERLLRQLNILLEGIVARPDEHISRLPLMTEAERRKILIDWNTTAAEFPRDRCIHDLFVDQTERTPDKIALLDGAGRVTYGELNAKANQLAHYLRRLGVGPETRVAICLDRSLDLIVGLLGILKAGGAYVPLEPTYPSERLSFILEDSKAHLVLTRKTSQALLHGAGAAVIELEAAAQEIARESKENPPGTVSAENAAHVIYTSGSTGKPKGVVSAHRASVNRFAWMWHKYPFAAGEVCCQKTALSFVDSIWEIFGPLLQGVPLVIIPDDVVKDPNLFVRSLAENSVTRLVLVPSLLRVMLESSEVPERLASLQYCVCSGETLPIELATTFRRQLPAATLINLYGSSEVAADVTGYEVQGSACSGSVPIGRPIANTRVLVLDSHFQPTAIGVPGEIYVGGEGLARGYLDRPDLTADRFIPDPTAIQPGAILFRTGDLGRYLCDGSIEYRGRRDHQVKIRGYRIELAEVEMALVAHSKVRQAVAVALPDERGEKHLLAYVVAVDAVPTAAELRAHLRERLPDFMLPAAFIPLQSLPLTTSGKINRLALPRPEAVNFAATRDFEAPRTPTEDLLANIWAESLNCQAVGINDDFFTLGGHSLLLARIAARIQDVFAIELPLRALFEAPTVAEMAKTIEATRRGVAGISADTIETISREGALPLSFAQERLWFFDQLEPGSAAYNITRIVRLRGSLDVDALQSSLNAIFERHEVLRSRFLTNHGRPALQIAAHETETIAVFDLSPCKTEYEQKAVGDLRDWITGETERPFDLAQGPLLRLALTRLDEEDHVLVLTMHHIVSDGWSIGIFLRELVSRYNALVRGDNTELAKFPALQAQYVDFAAWQRKTFAEDEGSAALREGVQFWRQQLAGAPALIDLPTDNPRPAAQTFRGAKQSVQIATETADGLKLLARSERVTLFMILLTAYQVLLSALKGQLDIVVGSATAGRNRRETEDLIGYFVNTIILRTKLAGDPNFREALRRVRAVALDAYANQEIPFEKVVDELQPSRTLSHNPLFQVWFVLQNAPSERDDWQGLEVTPIDVETTTTRHDLQLTLWQSADVIEGAFTYSTDLFEAKTIECIAEQFTNLLDTVTTDPNIRLSLLRAHLDQVGQQFRQRVGKHLEEASRQKLGSVKRRSVSDKL